MIFFDSCAEQLRWGGGAICASKPSAVTTALVGRAICYVFNADNESDADEVDNEDMLISVGKITKVYKQTSRQFKAGRHAEVRFVDDDGCRDVSLTLDMWNPHLSDVHEWIMLKPRRNRQVNIY